MPEQLRRMILPNYLIIRRKNNIWLNINTCQTTKFLKMSDCECDHASSDKSSNGSSLNKKCGIVIVFVFLIILAFIIYVPGPWNGTEHMQGANLGSKLSSAGWILYSRDGCPWCTKQKAEFSPSELSSLKVVECAENPACAEITGGYPAWKNTKTGLVSNGYLPRDRLNSFL